mgnify:FL=1
MEYTKGTFKDGNTGWRYGERITNGVNGFEIHWSDDGECVTDHVYTEDDAKLIAAAPAMYEEILILKKKVAELESKLNKTE